MFLAHNGKNPQVHPSAYVAPTATLCGDVSIDPNWRIMHGASIIAGGGKIAIGEQCIIFENAVVRSNTDFFTSQAVSGISGGHSPMTLFMKRK